MGFMVLVGFMVVFVLVILRDLARLEAKRNHLFSKLHGRLSSKYVISQRLQVFFSPSPKKFTNIRQKPYSQDDFDHDHNKRDYPKTAKYMIWSYNPRSISTSCLRDAGQRPGDAPAAPPDPQ
jgi:hypothetical protein